MNKKRSLPQGNIMVSESSANAVNLSRSRRAKRCAETSTRQSEDQHKPRLESEYKKLKTDKASTIHFPHLLNGKDDKYSLRRDGQSGTPTLVPFEEDELTNTKIPMKPYKSFELQCGVLEESWRKEIKPLGLPPCLPKLVVHPLSRPPPLVLNDDSLSD